MMQCPKCYKNYSDETVYCLQDGMLLIADAPEEPTVMRQSPFVQPVRQGVNPLFAYLAVGLFALVAGGAFVAWLKSDSSVATNFPTPSKTETPTSVASPTQEKPIEIKKQQEITRTPQPTVSQPAKVEQIPSNTASPQTYRVVGVAYNDVLFIRPQPNQLKQYVGKIPPNATDVQVHGNSQRVGKNIWFYISYEGISGWVNSKFLAKQ